MPIVAGLLAVAPWVLRFGALGAGVSRVIAAGGVLGVALRIFLLIIKIRGLFMLLYVAFFGLAAVFASELMSTVIGWAGKIFGFLMNAAGFGDIMTQIATLVGGMSAPTRELMARLNVWGNMVKLFKAYLSVTAVRAIPIIGRVVR